MMRLNRDPPPKFVVAMGVVFAFSGIVTIPVAKMLVETSAASALIWLIGNVIGFVALGRCVQQWK